MLKVGDKVTRLSDGQSCKVWRVADYNGQQIVRVEWTVTGQGGRSALLLTGQWQLASDFDLATATRLTPR